MTQFVNRHAEHNALQAGQKAGNLKQDGKYQHAWQGEQAKLLFEGRIPNRNGVFFYEKSS